MILKTNFTDAIRIMRNSGQSVFSEENKKKFGTIYTPEFVVEKTVDLAWKYLPEGVNKLDLTYCDPAVGDGNFLEYLYEKLMQETSIEDPVKRSRYILTKCLFGFEILEPMVQACKIRMIMLHQHTINQHGGDRDELLTLFDELQIYHGNTICLPADTEQEWYQARQEDEGGLLPEELRERKFDVIVGNPPYTRLVEYGKATAGNRSYCGFPNYLDMALIFLRWAADHLIDNGCCAYNISYSVLGKRARGARDARNAIGTSIAEIITTDQIQRYSENDGGDQNTCVLAFVENKKTNTLIYNDDIVEFSVDDWVAGSLQKNLEHLHTTYPFRATSITTHIPRMLEIRSVNSSSATDRKRYWKSFIFAEEGVGNYYLVASRRQYLRNDYKLVRTNDITKTIRDKYAGWVKYQQIDLPIGLWVLGYLATTVSSQYLATYMDPRQTGNFEMRTYLWSNLQVPDFDYYKQDRPERFQAYMSWVEANMRDKDAFLAGIDEQFEKLIENTEG